MAQISRRSFVKTGCGSAAVAALACSPAALLANPFGLPLGLQLYSVRDLLPANYESTLRQVAAIGYREVEAAGFFGHSAADAKQLMAQAGLRCVSAHYPLAQLQPQLDEIIAFARTLGLTYVICSSPARKNPSSGKNIPLRVRIESFTLDDWRWNAEQFNLIGAQMKRANLRFGYHNHMFEFHAIDGIVPYDELLRLTDPDRVTMEMDCGWVVVGGKRPEDYLRRYPDRISMLHVKDFKLGTTTASGVPVSAELGRGSIDYHNIFAAAKKGAIRHCFIEQEQFPDMPAMKALKVDADYMRSISS